MGRYYEYDIDGEWLILAGKTDADNDELSLHVAGKRDYWFHVHGLPGSHVILQNRAQKGLDADKAILKTAAAVAAYHSKARAAGIVPVDCCRADCVSKPPRAKAGTVTICRHTVIKIRPSLPKPSGND
ncbi:MAG: DUF814 domain-containing protein [Spartobacteria bacterium]|nr:DUF814 domain-containing protein [Spartobacteria bacterium]